LKVSVVIPAFRPTFLKQAIASVLTQGREDFDLLVSDDSGEDAVEKVVASFCDSRIRMVRTEGRVGGLENLRRIWEAADGDAVKILHDDDLLTPNCLPDLCLLLESNPSAPFIFGHRNIVAADGRVLESPRFIQENRAVTLTQQQLAETQLPSCANRVGEFPNILINKAAGVVWEDFAIYQGFELEMLVDMALYLNASAKGAAVGLGRTVAHYRKHASQNSTPGFSPLYTKVVCEWELFVRGEFHAGRLTSEQAQKGVTVLSRLYGLFLDRLPELGVLTDGHPALLQRIADGDRQVLDSEFRRSWASIDEAVLERKARS
jgi:glycosyltransferase involved in cell wall biosynthesis